MMRKETITKSFNYHTGKKNGFTVTYDTTGKLVQKRRLCRQY